ncbi:MAG TPA: S1/P1 nuclease [Pyrinomonadaceae bacterium]|nr:S1/P1 nuclease [Pyrinomonadaceae bacterium]
MPSRCIKTVLVAFISIFLAVPAFAWDDVGHKITGYIAWQRMSPKARENVIKVLRSAPEDSHLAVYYQSYGVRSEADKQLEYFMLVPTWADIVRDRAFPVRYEKYHKGDWHYTSVFWREVGGRAELMADKKPDGQAIEKLAEFEKVLRDPAVSDKDKAIALAWFLHIGGDIHQPLHTSSRVTDLEADGDRGGNTFLISPQGTPRADQQNLHWFWDSIVPRNIPYDFGFCEGCYVKHIAEAFTSRYSFDAEKNRLALSNYVQWKDESLKLAQTDVFRSDLKRFETPSDAYRRNALRVSEYRLTLAGYRMGETLNDIFGR